MSLRILHIVVQPVLVNDDGEELTAGPQIEPIVIPLSRLSDLVTTLPAEVERLDGLQPPTQ